MKDKKIQIVTPPAQPSEPRGAKHSEDVRPGTLEWRRGKARLRLSLGSFGRRMLTLATCRTEAEAEERRALLCPLADRLVAAGQIALGFPMLETAAKRDGKALADVVQAIELLAKGEARARATGTTTIRELAKQWTSGELAKAYPDHVKAKRTADTDEHRLRKHVLPIVGDLPLASFTLDHAQEVMRRIPADRSVLTRRHVAQLMHRLLSMAVFPLRILTANPLPRGFLPKPGNDKAKAYLYPDEDRKLLACGDVPLCDRLTYGFLNREGMRSNEAACLEWPDVDTERGAIALDKNKTDEPRAWALRPDVLRALRAWRKLREERGDHDPHVFPRSFDHGADRFRAHLEAAGIERKALFERSTARRPIRFHDTRATFVTLALANGRTEAWVADRTGHKSSDQIAKYRRAARSIGELGLGDLAPLDASIPELAEGSPDGGTGPVQPAPGVASGSQNAYETSGSAPLATPFPASGSSGVTPVGVQVPSFAPFEITQVSAAPESRASEPENGPYQIRTSAPDGAAGEPAARSGATGRAGVLVRLAGELASLVATNDLEGARAVYETIGRLLTPAGRSPEHAAGAVVVDLEAERERRAGR